MINKETTNKSFINMWHYLQDLNVENNSFMLELKNKDLKNKDITNKDIEQEVFEECVNNIWFFFREYVRLIYPISMNSIESLYMPFVLTPENMAMIYLYDKGVNFIKDKRLYTGRNNIGLGTTLRLLEMYNYIFRNEYIQYSYHLSIPDENIFTRNNDDIKEKYLLLSEANRRLLYSLDDTIYSKLNLNIVDKASRYYCNIPEINEVVKYAFFTHLYNYKPLTLIDIISNINNKNVKLYGITYNDIKFSDDDVANKFIINLLINTGDFNKVYDTNFDILDHSILLF